MNERTPSPRLDPSRVRLGAEGRMFLREAARDLRTVGAVAPSGPALARLLTDPLTERGARSLRVLEVGAGTGSVTRVLLSRLPAGSRLGIVEPNPRFVGRLRDLVRGHERVRVHEAFVEELGIHRRYDVIVSGLPFTNFTADRVEAIMTRYLQLLEPDGTLTYFAYRATRHARTLLSSPAEAHRHRTVEDVLATYRRHHPTACRTAWTNLPPAGAWRLTPAPEPLRTPVVR
ncbi:translation initiation factor IF-2 [Embleya scabrispora]|uniref:Translation initiation factor IF-2 n=1 Tax=Embleya scabrispora TaxID=159449 RepID=A0A1T3NK65_9ACTN|nr:methyltransferase domain-containing protein [Embleya scabrispora]OPC77021.1 translation initiation factor IF-2 [Embleya scabrispora]